jgi:hypothetical protein
MTKLSAIPIAAAMALLAATTAFAQGDTLVTVGSSSPTLPFSQNKQNEPAIANDANNPAVLVAGSNDEIDEQGCDGTHCPFTAGVGVSGVYFSFDRGQHWTQPTYDGWSARNCLSGPCTPVAGGPIGTLPGYFEHGLVSDGDPGVAFGPTPVNGAFSWANGSRLYYTNLTSNFSSVQANEAFPGFEAIAISRTDHVDQAAASKKSAWMPPVIISHQSNTTFSDKEQVWADNAASSPFFGNVYVCWARFQSSLKSHSGTAQLQVAVSSDGGDTWTEHPIGAAANNGERNPLDGCTVRTASNGTAYLFGKGTISSAGKATFELMSTSSNGGSTWSIPTPVTGPTTQPGVFDSVLGRPVIDGVAGARSDLANAPSVDIANGAPSGNHASNRIVMTYVSGTIDAPHVFFTESADGGANWSTPQSIEKNGDRGYYTAPAISPDGTNVYVVYNAFTTPFRTNTSDPRALVGVVLQRGPTGGFTQVHRGDPGDPRGSSQNNLVGEFLGDYVYATATNFYGAAVWNDTRNAADCPAIDAYRAALRGMGTGPRPAPLTDCPGTFGNSDIWGGAFTAKT